jgi:hypothetical protein
MKFLLIKRLKNNSTKKKEVSKNYLLITCKEEKHMSQIFMFVLALIILFSPLILTYATMITSMPFFAPIIILNFYCTQYSIIF